eukprot:11395561-Prorocentrum_lima.AAC.1
MPPVRQACHMRLATCFACQRLGTGASGMTVAHMCVVEGFDGQASMSVQTEPRNGRLGVASTRG